MASTKDEITAIAVEHGYTGRKPDSIAKAIDALADTLAGEDVKSGRSIAGAIHALAPYIGSGGGSGVELGPLQLFPLVYGSKNPTVGGSLQTEGCWLDIKAGDIEIVEGGEVVSNTFSMKIAANMTVTLYATITGVIGVEAAYIVTYQDDIPFPQITDITEWDGEYTYTPGGDNSPWITFTMPELGENQVLAFKFRRMA